MRYLRWLLFPFSLIYGLVVIIRNWCYDAGIFKSHKFNKPVISVGNLEVGGAGKSPMTEYLVRLLKDHHELATLSRGYGRSTTGYVEEGPGGGDQELRAKGHLNQVPRAKSQEPRQDEEAGAGSQQARPGEGGEPLGQRYAAVNTTGAATLASRIGDEPAQFRRKFRDITVAVCEDRVAGLNKLMPNHDLVIMDDAYQHRAVEPGLSILLFDHDRIRQPHLLLPAGNMREPMNGRWRAQIIVVSKCPQMLSVEEKTIIAQKIQPLPYQALFFTSIAYQGLQDLDHCAANQVIDTETAVFLLTGIANPEPLVRHLKGLTGSLTHYNYPDHHRYTLKNIAKLADGFWACTSQNKIIITTEKDAQRLEEFREQLQALPVFVIPIGITFSDDSKPQFDSLIFDHVRSYSPHHRIH